jgi:hypothetical protein
VTHSGTPLVSSFWNIWNFTLSHLSHLPYLYSSRRENQHRHFQFPCSLKLCAVQQYKCSKYPNLLSVILKPASTSFFSVAIPSKCTHDVPSFDLLCVCVCVCVCGGGGGSLLRHLVPEAVYNTRYWFDREKGSILKISSGR